MSLPLRLFGDQARDAVSALVPFARKPEALLTLLERLERGVLITVQPIRRKRSLSQNALYHAWLTIMASDLGYDRDEMHEALKARLLGTREVFGATIANSTTKLDVMTFGEFLDGVQRIAAEHGIVLPSTPEEWHERDEAAA